MKFINNTLFRQTILITILFISCNKDIFDISYTGFEGKVLMPQAVDGRNNFSLQLISDPWIMGFGASYGGTTSPAPKDITVNFALKEDWISQYNKQHETNYIPLPEGSYFLSGLSTTIKKGKINSDSLRITIDRKKLDKSLKYMFPITLLSASNEPIDSTLKTAWFRIDTLIRKETDITSSATLKVSNDNSGGAGANEGSSKLIDNNYSTKFLVFNMNTILPNFWFQLTFTNPVILGAYTFTSGNDAPGRDPKNWVLSGSNDGNTWTTLDTRNNENFSGRNMTIRYEFDNTSAYKYYRVRVLNLLDNNPSLFQMSEWRVIQYD